MEGHEFDFTLQQHVDAFEVTDGIPAQDELSNGHSHLLCTRANVYATIDATDRGSRVHSPD